MAGITFVTRHIEHLADVGDRHRIHLQRAVVTAFVLVPGRADLSRELHIESLVFGQLPVRERSLAALLHGAREDLLALVGRHDETVSVIRHSKWHGP